jgi:hypothetical protein
MTEHCIPPIGSSLMLPIDTIIAQLAFLTSPVFRRLVTCGSPGSDFEFGAGKLTEDVLADERGDVLADEMLLLRRGGREMGRSQILKRVLIEARKRCVVV